MSVIQSIRDKGAWIIFVIIALALIAFILQDSSFSRGRGMSDMNDLGSVNGQKIERADFEEKVSMQERMYGAQGFQRDQILSGVWNQEVDRLVTGEEIEKLGIQIGKKELDEVLFGENSPFRQEFTDPETGIFKVEDAKKALDQIKKSKNAEQQNTIAKYYIEPALENAKRNKFVALVQKNDFIPSWMMNKMMADNSATASFEYVMVPYQTVSDSSIKVTDADIQAYIKKRAKEYTREEEVRNIIYTYFSAAPTSQDSLEALNAVMALKNEFVSTSDAKAFLGRVGSEMPFYDSYFSKNKIQVPNKDSILRLSVGQVFGPYLDGDNYVMAKLLGTKVWPDSAKVRHILIGTVDAATQQPKRSDEEAKKLADSIAALVKSGQSFDDLCVRFSEDAGSKDKGGVYDFFEQGRMVTEFNDFSFDNPVGTKGVVKTNFGYHYIEVLGHRNPQPAYKIAYLGKQINASNETVGNANTAAAQFAAKAKNKKQFEDEAEKNNLPTMFGVDIKKNDFTIAGLGNSRQLVRWIYESKDGAVSEPIEVGDRYIVALVTAINKKGTLAVGDAKFMVENYIRNEKKAQQIIAKAKGTTLTEIAKNYNTDVMLADSVSFGTPFIPGVGAESKVAGAGFNKELQGKVSSPIAGNAGVFFIQGKTIAAKPMLGNESDNIRQGLIQSQRMAAFRGFESLKKVANIKDNRFIFY